MTKAERWCQRFVERHARERRDTVRVVRDIAREMGLKRKIQTALKRNC